MDVASVEAIDHVIREIVFLLHFAEETIGEDHNSIL